MATTALVFRILGSPIDPLKLELPEPRPRNGSDWFFDFCQMNRDIRLERTAEGEILVMAPAGTESGYRELKTSTQLDVWAERDGRGRAFGSNAGFILPNGATRSPDAAWVKLPRLAALSADKKRKFAPLCPDFVIEVRSHSDRLPQLQKKMEEYRENGAALGWLIDPATRKVHIYRPGRRVEILKHPKRVKGDPELPGFVLDLARIWKPDF